MTNGNYDTKPEAPGSSAATAVNVAIGAVVGASAIALAPVLLPAIGLGVVATGIVAIGAPVATVIGGWLGYKFGKKT